MLSARRSAAVATLLLALALPFGARAKIPKAPPDPETPGLNASERVAALVDRVKLEQSGTRTLAARFVQRKTSEFLVEPEVSGGRFAYAAPDRVLWQYATPKPITVLVDGREMLTWYRDLGRAEKVKIGRYTEQVLRYMGAGSSIDQLYEYFDVKITFPTAEPYRLQLTPRYERIRKRLESMTVWIDRQSFLPVRFRYVERGGDTTEYELLDLERNGELPADTFAVKLPAEVEVRTVDLGRGATP